MKLSATWGLLLAIATLLLPARPLSAAPMSRHELNHGYSLLYHLCDQEKPIELILLVKTTPPEVGAFAKKISQTAKDELAVLDRFQADSGSHFDDMGLPAFELDVRESIKADKRQQLLFGTTGNDFARALLVSQIEATTYGMHLAKILAEDEPNAKRSAELARISDKWQSLRREAYRLIRAY